MQKKAVIIGGGIAGLSAACCLAKEGVKVTLLEKNDQPGGRARQFSAEGFTFDMGPSWYWMPDIFETYFNQFNHTTSDFFELKRLDPSYRIYFSKDELLDVPASLDELFKTFESLEQGSSKQLEKFLAEGEYKYNIGMKKFARKPGLSLLEYADPRLAVAAFRLHMFQSISTYIKKYFSDHRIIKLLEFPVHFLGAKPEKTPALYSLMNYADIALGTWYPLGGMFKIIEALVTIAGSLGVEIRTNESVEKINVSNGKATSVISNGKNITADVVIGGADYHHVEQHLLDKEYRTYTEAYWDSRDFAPSCLLFYLGLDKKINIRHHNLFYDADYDKHLTEIYEQNAWPSDPLFYISCPSKTDPGVAPEGCENMLILIPVAVGLKEDKNLQEKYFDTVISRLEHLTGEKILEHIIFKRTYAHANYSQDYNAYKGNAFGLANTLKQTAIFKPSIRSKKVKNLFFTGQLTAPGPGVPPSLISGEMVAEVVCSLMKSE